MKIGLVLSGGGARGFAHIGILKVLKKNNIKIDYIAGCSAGALVGACYAYNQNIEELERLVVNIKNTYDVFDFALAKSGFSKDEKVEKYILDYLQQEDIKAEEHKKVENQRIQEYIRSYFQGKKEIATDKYTFEELKIPLVVNATDIITGKEIVFNKGKLMPAIMASIAYPGVFHAKKYEGKLLIDGGVINPLPLSLIQDKADYLILVNVSQSGLDITENSSFKDILLKAVSTGQGRIIEHELSKCTKKYILIEPELKGTTIIDFKDIKGIIKSGEKAATDAIAQIQKDIGSFG